MIVRTPIKSLVKEKLSHKFFPGSDLLRPYYKEPSYLSELLRTDDNRSDVSRVGPKLMIPTPVITPFLKEVLPSLRPEFI